MNTYVPPKKILENYARVLVRFALGQQDGILPGEVVECVVPDIAKPLALELQNEILRAGGHSIIRLAPTGFDKDFYNLANSDQLTFFSEKYMRARADMIDHSLVVLADVDPFLLSDVEPKKILLARDARKKFRDWLFEKESNGKHTWTIGLWGVDAKAKLVGLTIEEYWDQIIHACFLDAEDPILEWKRVKETQQNIKTKLNYLKIDSLHSKGPDVDLTVKLGANRHWKGGANRNIPSFELFTSPDWRGTNGWIKFNQPLYRYGNVISGIRLEFKDGAIVNASATQGEKFLLEMIKTENANKLGEYSLTDNRLSRITHPMAETLYDENIGGPQGNMHVAIGMSYKDCFRDEAGKTSSVPKKDWERLGYNESAEHTDMVSTIEREVTATLVSGEKLIIYSNGQFVL